MGFVELQRRDRGFPVSDVAQALERELQENVSGEVRFDRGSRALYATDASNYRQVPIGVVVPKSLDDVVATVAACRAYGVPILSRGGGTSLAGQCCNIAVVVDFSKYLCGGVEIDVERRLARVLPGVVLDDLRVQAERHGLTFGPDPATHGHCTLGGMIGNNACGVHAVLSEFYGPGPRTEDNVEELEILTYDGQRMRVGRTSEEELDAIVAAGGRRGDIYGKLKSLRDRYADTIRKRFPDIPRRVSGYNLPALLPENGFNLAAALVGTEGTCATVLEATVKLVPHLGQRVLLLCGYPSVYEAGDHVPEIRELRPVGLEGIDNKLVEYAHKGHLPTHEALLPPGDGWLFVEFGAERLDEARARAEEAMRYLKSRPGAPAMRLIDDEDEKIALWELRESGLGATAFVPGERDAWPGWEDSAVPPDTVGAYLRDLRSLMKEYDLDGALYGHFGQGCIHTRLPFDLRTESGRRSYASFTRDAAELVVRYGGSLSGEHGDGQARGDLLNVMYGPELMEAFREFKAIWDPDGKMNPGKVIDALPRTEALRLGRGFEPVRPATHFHFPSDHDSFVHATMRCVGVGKCRRDHGGTMCPSYMVTREEKHTTRGRAHLLFEMLRGEVITDGWKSKEVKEALDLCLSCKGCKGDCPVNVDVGTYKSEFLSHYYEGRLRPRQAYAFGLIMRWARMAKHVPWLANFVAHAPGLSWLAKGVAGMAQQREVPWFAGHTFRDWWKRRERRRGARTDGERPGVGPGRRRVMLWPDTFNDHFHPHVLAAAADVLESAGCEVVLPRGALCCGRPLYDFGMLDRAKELWREILDSVGPEIDEGTPLVGVEPSCVAAFRDELAALYPDDPRARKLSSNTFLFAEFMNGQLDGYEPPRLVGEAVFHGHCHQKAVLSTRHDTDLLRKMGLEVDVPTTGCCGMAGAFGFDKDKYDVSVAAGEHQLMPNVRRAPPATLIVTDGFSCRHQIEELSDRRALTVPEVVELAMHMDRVTQDERPERAVEPFLPAELMRPPASLRPGASLGVLALVALAGAALSLLIPLFT